MTGLTLDGYKELDPIYLVDRIEIMCRVFPNTKKQTTVTLVGPIDSFRNTLFVNWNGKRASISSGVTMSWERTRVVSSSRHGTPVRAPFEHVCYSTMALGKLTTSLKLEFSKQELSIFKVTKQIAGVRESSYGNLELPASVQGLNILFFWPADPNNAMSMEDLPWQKLTAFLSGAVPGQGSYRAFKNSVFLKQEIVNSLMKATASLDNHG